MALTDPLQWVVIGVLVVGVIVLIVVFVLFRIIRVLDKAERYFDSKVKESKQGAAFLGECTQ